MMNILGLHHVALRAAEVEKLAVFYRDVLGFKEEKRFYYDDQKLRSIWLKHAEILLMIEQTHSALKSDTGFYLLAFTIEMQNREKFIAHLNKHHIQIEKTSDYSIFFNDPEGNRLAFSHYPNLA